MVVAVSWPGIVYLHLGEDSLPLVRLQPQTEKNEVNIKEEVKLMYYSQNAEPLSNK